MRAANHKKTKMKNQDGATIVFIALLSVMFVAFTAMAVDIAHLYVVKNELHNAADAGALAGARRLYINNGTAVDPGANQFAYDAAILNNSENVTVEVNWTPGTNTGDVERGHWSFATRAFTPNASTAQVNLWNATTAQLDADLNFINAVRVRTRRQATQADSFFARIVGFAGFDVISESVAYIGFAGTLQPFTTDLPIAICKEAITSSGVYSCSVGRLINSGNSSITTNSGGWTDYNQTGNPCSGGTNASILNSLVSLCPALGNSTPLILGKNTATTGGQVQSAFTNLYNCWVSQTGQTQLWPKTLPVVTCPSNNIGTCEQIVGAVTVDIVWMTDQGNDPQFNNAPQQMGAWSSSDPNGQNRWSSFVSYFQLQNLDGSAASYMQKCIYFRPQCQPQIPTGITGGQNFGILAQVPVLVQ